MSSFRSKPGNGYAAQPDDPAAADKGSQDVAEGIVEASGPEEIAAGVQPSPASPPELGQGSAESWRDPPAAAAGTEGKAFQDASERTDHGPDFASFSRFGEELDNASLRAQLQAAQDQVLRGLADLENLRKRTANEVANAHKYAVESFAESLVPVLDSLELSLKVDKASVDSLREGAEATLRLLHSAFARHRLIAIEPVGERFDPNRHQAISMVSGSSVHPPVPPNHVVSVLQKGYLIHDRVIRPALVTVAQA